MPDNMEIWIFFASENKGDLQFFLDRRDANFFFW